MQGRAALRYLKTHQCLPQAEKCVSGADMSNLTASMYKRVITTGRLPNKGVRAGWSSSSSLHSTSSTGVLRGVDATVRGVQCADRVWLLKLRREVPGLLVRLCDALSAENWLNHWLEDGAAERYELLGLATDLARRYRLPPILRFLQLPCAR